MALRNRWIVRTVNQYTVDGMPLGRVYFGPASHCVECRATCAVAFFGTESQCRVKARELNAAQ